MFKYGKNEVEITDPELERVLRQYEADIEDTKDWYDEHSFGSGSYSCGTALDNLRTEYCEMYPEFEEWF